MSSTLPNNTPSGLLPVLLVNNGEVIIAKPPPFSSILSRKVLRSLVNNPTFVPSAVGIASILPWRIHEFCLEL